MLFELGRLYTKTRYHEQARQYLGIAAQWAHGAAAAQEAQRLLATIED